MGTGEDALKAMAEATMEQLEFAVILVANHRITFLSKCEAKGELWARCYAQNKREGYYEQIIKYTDQYELSQSQNLETASWKFKHRRHHLWFGQSKESPLMLPPADWPKNNIGLGRSYCLMKQFKISESELDKLAYDASFEKVLIFSFTQF